MKDFDNTKTRGTVGGKNEAGKPSPIFETLGRRNLMVRARRAFANNQTTEFVCLQTRRARFTKKAPRLKGPRATGGWKSGVGILAAVATGSASLYFAVVSKCTRHRGSMSCVLYMSVEVMRCCVMQMGAGLLVHRAGTT